MVTTCEAVDSMLEWRRGRVSSKRQVTIPQKFFEQLNLTQDIEFAIKDGNLLIRAAREHTGTDYFADLILADLIEEGVPKEELVIQLRQKLQELSKAKDKLINDSKHAALHYNRATYHDETTEIFSAVMED